VFHTLWKAHTSLGVPLQLIDIVLINIIVIL